MTPFPGQAILHRDPAESILGLLAVQFPCQLFATVTFNWERHSNSIPLCEKFEMILRPDMLGCTNSGANVSDSLSVTNASPEKGTKYVLVLILVVYLVICGKAPS